MADIGRLNVRVGLDSTGFQNGIGKLNQEMRKVQSEFKLASAELGKHGRELDKLKTKSDSLTRQKELQRQKVEALRKAHQKSVETKGKDAKATGDLEIKLNQASSRLVQMEQDLTSVNRQIEIQSSNFYKLGESLEPIGQSMQDMGKKMESLGNNLTKKVTLPLVGIGMAAVKVGSDFQSSMSEVQAISGATGEDLKALEDIAKEMGATTKFSASQSAEGLKYMALAGWEVQEMTAALPGVLDLAAAANMSLASASDIVTDTMSQFQMEAKRAGEAADIFAVASSKSNTDVQQLGEAMKYAGASAHAAGMDLAQTAGVLGIFADNGIKGSMAGTTFTAMLRDMRNNAVDGQLVIEEMGKSFDELSKVDLYNLDGSMRSMYDIMHDLEMATQGMNTQQKDMALNAIFGTQAIKGANVILAEGTDSLYELTHALYDSEGAASDMAETMQDNLQGELTKLKSALEGVGIQIFEVLVPHLNTMVEALQRGVTWFASLDEGTQATIIKFAALAAAAGPLLSIGGKFMKLGGGLVKTVGGLSKALGAKTVAAGGAAKATGGLVAAKGLLAKGAVALTGPIGLAVAGVAALGIGTVKLAKHMREDSIPAVELFTDEVSEMTQEALGDFFDLNEGATLALNQLAWSGQEVSQEMADGISGSFSQMAEQIQEGLKNHHEQSLAEMQSFIASSQGLSEEEQAAILQNVQDGYENRRQQVEDGEARIKEVLDLASEEKRALTKAEQEEINAIQQMMVETGIQALSENEIEAKAIMERMKAHSGEMSALQAAEVVRNSLEQKEGAIQAAEEQYDGVLREIIKQRDELGSVSEEQAEKLIAEATRQREESIKNAEMMHEKVISEAKNQAGEHVNQVDWTTGEVLSKWAVMRNNVTERSREMARNVSESWGRMRESTRTTFSNMRETVSARWGEMRENTRQTASNIRDRWSEATQSMVSSTRERFSSMAESVGSAFSRVRDSISSGISRLREWNNQRVENKSASFETTTTNRVINAPATNVAKNFAGTSFFQGGLTIVGELGPELVELPRGSKIYNDDQTNQMMGDSTGRGGGLTLNIDKFVNNTEKDIEQLAYELEFYRQRVSLGRGRG